MPATTLGQGLAYVNWAVLTALALGGFAFAASLRRFSEVSVGYARFMAVASAVLGVLAFVADLGLPPPEGLPISAEPALDPFRRGALAAFTGLAFASSLGRLAGRRRLLESLAVVAGLVAALAAAIAWGGGVISGAPLLVQIVMLAAATGGVFAALVLGHWYLVTPRLSERPLLLASRALLWVLVLQVLLFGAWVSIGAGPGAAPFAALTGNAAVLVWLRLFVSLLFPLALAWMAVQTARTRSMESATGLLYIATAAIAAGTIASAGLFFGAGLLV